MQCNFLLPIGHLCPTLVSYTCFLHTCVLHTCPTYTVVLHLCPTPLSYTCVLDLCPTHLCPTYLCPTLLCPPPVSYTCVLHLFPTHHSCFCSSFHDICHNWYSKKTKFTFMGVGGLGGGGCVSGQVGLNPSKCFLFFLLP